MSYSVATSTRIAGPIEGNFLDDLTNPTVGQWPKTQAIKRITNIVVYTGDIVDSVRVTYDVEIDGVVNSVTVQHGGNGGYPTLAFDIGADEKLVAVYGGWLPVETEYGKRTLLRLSFIVANSSGFPATVQVYSTSGNYTTEAEKFELSFPLTAAFSYSFQPEGKEDSYVQAIGFSNVLDNPPVAL